MDEKPDQIIGQIETHREELGRNLDELQNKVRRSTDWKTYFDRNPMLMLGAALGGGILLGSMVGGKRSHKQSSRYSSSSSSSFAGAGTGMTGAMGSTGTRKPAGPATSIQKSRVNETMDHVKAALIAFGITKAKDFLTQAIPGFDHHLDEAERSKREQHSGSSMHGYGGSSQDFRTHTEGSSFRGGYSSASDYRSPESTTPQPVAP